MNSKVPSMCPFRQVLDEISEIFTSRKFIEWLDVMFCASIAGGVSIYPLARVISRWVFYNTQLPEVMRGHKVQPYPLPLYVFLGHVSQVTRARACLP